MDFLRFFLAPVVTATMLASSPASAVTIFTEIEANDTQATANHIAMHDGSLDIYGFQKSDFDWFSFHGTAGDTITLEVQDEGPNPSYPVSDYYFDSVMALHNSSFQLEWDDDDDTNIDSLGRDLPQRVRDQNGSYIERTLLETGLYFVRLENFGISDTDTYNYRLVVRGLTATDPTAAAVPLPAGLPLLLTAMGLVGMVRRWHQS